LEAGEITIWRRFEGNKELEKRRGGRARLSDILPGAEMAERWRVGREGSIGVRSIPARSLGFAVSNE
jgi:hypothetical protein